MLFLEAGSRRENDFPCPSAQSRSTSSEKKERKVFNKFPLLLKLPEKANIVLAFLAHFVKATENFHFSVIDFSFFFDSRRKVSIFVFCVSDKFVFRLFFFGYVEMTLAVLVLAAAITNNFSVFISLDSFSALVRHTQASSFFSVLICVFCFSFLLFLASAMKIRNTRFFR